MIHALIDGDWILYAAGFAGQKKRLVCPILFDTREFANITELKGAVAKELDSELDESEDFVYTRDALDPEAFFYHSAKKMIEAQLQKIGEKFGEEKVTYTVMMDGDGNFRNQIATIRPYKGTRSVHAKPLMYNNIRQYLLDAFLAEVIFNHETDDEMAIRQTVSNDGGGRSIIVAVDKDMLQVPGWHLNPNKGFKKVSQHQGDLFVYRQAASGDAVDNIGGAYKVGPAAAKKAITADMEPRQMWDTLVGVYENSIVKHGDHYNGLDAEAAALENMRLVYLRREPGEIWTPPELK